MDAAPNDARREILMDRDEATADAIAKRSLKGWVIAHEGGRSWIGFVAGYSGVIGGLWYSRPNGVDDVAKPRGGLTAATAIELSPVYQYAFGVVHQQQGNGGVAIAPQRGILPVDLFIGISSAVVRPSAVFPLDELHQSDADELLELLGKAEDMRQQIRSAKSGIALAPGSIDLGKLRRAH